MYFRASSKVQHILIPNPHGMAVALKYVHVLYFELYFALSSTLKYSTYFELYSHAMRVRDKYVHVL